MTLNDLEPTKKGF